MMRFFSFVSFDLNKKFTSNSSCLPKGILTDNNDCSDAAAIYNKFIYLPISPLNYFFYRLRGFMFLAKRLDNYLFTQKKAILFVG